MSLKYKNINYSCRVSKMDNNQTTLSCSPRNVEKFELISDPAKLGWYQIAGTVSGSGGAQESNVFTTDGNWAYNNVRIPSNYKDIPDLELLSIANGVSTKATSIESSGSGVKITFDRNTNATGDQTFWFKNVLKDNVGGKTDVEFTAVGVPY